MGVLPQHIHRFHPNSKVIQRAKAIKDVILRILPTTPDHGKSFCREERLRDGERTKGERERGGRES